MLEKKEINKEKRCSCVSFQRHQCQCLTLYLSRLSRYIEVQCFPNV